MTDPQKAIARLARAAVLERDAWALMQEYMFHPGRRERDNTNDVWGAVIRRHQRRAKALELAARAYANVISPRARDPLETREKYHYGVRE